MTDRLPELAARLDELDEVAIAEHPDALEAVQAALVAELDALAGAGRAAPSGGPDDAGPGRTSAGGDAVPRP